MGCLSAEITRDGEFILATGDPKHPDYHIWKSDCFTTAKPVAIVFDREGPVVATQPLADDLAPDRAALAEAVLRKTGKQLLSDGRQRVDRSVRQWCADLSHKRGRPDAHHQPCQRGACVPRAVAR